MILDKFPEIVFATSKVSDGNMAFAKEHDEEVLRNRQKFLSSLGINLNSLIALKQLHGSKIIRVDKTYQGKGAFKLSDALDADGLITNRTGIYLMVKIADCHQIALYDPGNHAIALIHAGWQSLDQGIIQKTIQAMIKSFGTNPKNLLARFGPSIGPCCYKKLKDLKQANEVRWKPYITKDNEETFSVDLWRFAEDELKAYGIPSKNIENPKICTYHNKDYYSHRRSVLEGDNDFRFITILGIRD